MRILVIGAGAVGGWLAATLARGGAEVSLLARGAALAAIRSDGLIVHEGDKRETFRLAAADNAGALPQPDAVVLAAKTYAFTDIVTAAKETFANGPIVVTATNGLPWWFLSDLKGPLAGQSLECVDPGGEAAPILAKTRPIGSVVHASMRAEAPGVISIVAVDKLIVGEPGGDVSRETSRFSQFIKDGGVECVVTPDIRLAIWAKLWGNMNMNPVSALTRRTANGILGDPRLLQLVHDMMTEFVAVGARMGLTLPMSVEERLVVTRRLGDFRTSMLNDVEAGRPLEVDGLLGVVVELAEKLGEPVPATRTVYALARTLPHAA